MTRKEQLHLLLETQNYRQLCEEEPAVIQEMLLLGDISEAEDFFAGGETLNETSFWLYYDAVHGSSLLLGGYAGDVSEITAAFLRERLPEAQFRCIQEDIRSLYVDIDDDLGHTDNLKRQISACNQHLSEGCRLQLDFEDEYCAGAYFLSVHVPENH